MAMKISIKAVCAGVAIGLIGSTLASLAIAMVLSIPLTPGALESQYSNPTLLIADLIVSLIVVFLSGYVTGKIAKANPLPSVMTMAIIQLVAIILVSLSQLQLTPLWYTAVTYLTIIPVAYWGGNSAREKA
jgi:hypothetical protein